MFFSPGIDPQYSGRVSNSPFAFQGQPNQAGYGQEIFGHHAMGRTRMKTVTDGGPPAPPPTPTALPTVGTTAMSGPASTGTPRGIIGATGGGPTGSYPGSPYTL